MERENFKEYCSSDEKYILKNQEVKQKYKEFQEKLTDDDEVEEVPTDTEKDCKISTFGKRKFAKFIEFMESQTDELIDLPMDKIDEVLGFPISDVIENIAVLGIRERVSFGLLYS